MIIQYGHQQIPVGSIVVTFPIIYNEIPTMVCGPMGKDSRIITTWFMPYSISISGITVYYSDNYWYTPIIDTYWNTWIPGMHWISIVS